MPRSVRGHCKQRLLHSRYPPPPPPALSYRGRSGLLLPELGPHDGSSFLVLPLNPFYGGYGAMRTRITLSLVAMLAFSLPLACLAEHATCNPPDDPDVVATATELRDQGPQGLAQA